MQSQLGRPLGRHGVSKGIAALIWLSMTALACAGAFVLMLPTLIAGNPEIRFSGDPRVLYGVGAALLLVAIAVLAWWWNKSRSLTRIELYEEGLVAWNHRQRHEYRYDEIRDIYDYVDWKSGLSKGLAFQPEKSRAWTFISSNVTDYQQLRQNLQMRFVQQRGDLLYRQLQEGQTVVFRKISGQRSRIQSFFLNGRFDMPMDDISLSQDTLTIDGQSIPVRRIQGLDSSILTNRIEILDHDDHVLFDTHVSALLSSSLLHALLQRLAQNDGRRV